MRIGILTFHWANHFGAVLQAWALVKVLNEIKQEAEIIDFVPSDLYITQSRIFSLKDVIKKNRILGSSGVSTLYPSFGEILNYLWLQEHIRSSEYDAFRSKYLSTSSIFTTNLNELKQECDKYDACVVGSDQVWRADFLKLSGYAYLLPFKLKHIKIAFSASVASDILAYPKLIDLYKFALRDFSFVSIREDTHAELLSLLTGRKIYSTLDPSLIVRREELNSLAAKGNSIPKLGKKYAVVYNLGFSMLPVAQKLVDELDLPVVIYQKPPLLPFRRSLLYSKYFRDSSTFYHTGPKEIMGLIKDAEFVITDSYHGALASIQFEKDFAAIMSKSINYHLTLRFTDLLKKLNLIDRIVWNSEKNRDCIGNLVNERTNYISVKKVLKELRKESIELLKMALLD